MTKVVFCYPLVNGYIAACWRELAKHAGIDLSIVSFAPESNDNIAFSRETMRGLDHHPLGTEFRKNSRKVSEFVQRLNPDVLFISGWHHRAFRRIYFDKALEGVPIVMLMDNQFRGDWRQLVGRYVLRQILRRVTYLFVTGERAHQLARFWSVPSNKIVRGCVSVDYEMLSPLLASRLERREWPRSFLFVGRYESVKALDVLVEAYRIYRTECDDPWPLRCAGTGPDAAMIEGVPGIEDLGFVDPGKLREYWLTAGCFVISSRFDPWPLVVVEACAAGLPVIATDACGSTVENVRHQFNGYIAPEAEAYQLSEGMKEIHERHAELPNMGRRSQHLAAAYSAEMWTIRVIEMLKQMKLCVPECVPMQQAE